MVDCSYVDIYSVMDLLVSNERQEMSKVRSLRQIRETTLIDSSVKGVHPEVREFQQERIRYKFEREDHLCITCNDKMFQIGRKSG